MLDQYLAKVYSEIRADYELFFVRSIMALLGHEPSEIANVASRIAGDLSRLAESLNLMMRRFKLN